MANDIKRVPVTPDTFRGGINRPTVSTGPADPIRARIAKVATGAGFGGMRSAGGMGREGSMMLDSFQTTTSNTSGFRLDAYRTSYANGLDQRSGTYDIPTYFSTMNEQNGGVLYWPVTLQEKYSWYRYWARTDAYIGRSLELLADLPMSKITLNMPKMEGKEKLREEIKEKCQYQLDVLGIFDLCRNLLWELNCIGNVFLFHEWNDELKMWSRAVMLPPEEVYVFQFPFSDNKRIEYRPERLIGLIKGAEGQATAANMGQRDDLQVNVLKNIPESIVGMIQDNNAIVMDSDPFSGSFCCHLARRKHPYHDLGASVLERVLVQMLQKEHYRYTQLSLASRNMTPKPLITAPGLMPEEVDELRTQVDLSYLDPEYSIVTNYEINWEMIGAQDRLLDLDREYERIDNQIFAGLGVTRELLTGESSFSGGKITVEILNTMFMLSREVLTNYIETQLFLPICEAHGWYEERKNGVKKYFYPSVGFNRLTIRDNSEVFDSLFQLYQKGSLNVDVIYELFNLNPEEVERKLYEDLWTVKDPNYNRLTEDTLSEMGRALTEKSNILDKQIEYLGLEKREGEMDDEDGGYGGFSGFGGKKEDSGGELDTDGVADAVADELPSGASEEEINEVVNEVTEEEPTEEKKE